MPTAPSVHSMPKTICVIGITSLLTTFMDRASPDAVANLSWALLGALGEYLTDPDERRGAFTGPVHPMKVIRDGVSILVTPEVLFKAIAEAPTQKSLHLCVAREAISRFMADHPGAFINMNPC